MSTFWKIFITVAVTAAVVGSGVFYLMQKQIDNIRNDNLKQIDDLNKQIKALKSTNAASTAPSPATTDETAGWKTYTSTTNNYTIKYPSDWTYEDSPAISNIVFQKAPGDDDAVLIYTKSTSLTLQQYTENEKVGKKAGGATTAASYGETVGGQPASKVVITSPDGTSFAEYLVVKDGKLFNIAVANNINSTGNKMLQTFQFTK